MAKEYDLDCEIIAARWHELAKEQATVFLTYESELKGIGGGGGKEIQDRACAAANKHTDIVVKMGKEE